MRIKGYHLWLLAIFLVVFASRMYISSQTDLFSDDNSYFTLRQVEHIVDTGKPLIYDDLSYGGRTLIFSPFYFYLLSAAYIINHKIIMLKIFVNLLATLLVLASFLIADEVTKSKKIALVTAFLSGFIPVYFQETVNSLSIYSLIVPLTFFSIYYLMMLNKDKKYSTHFLVLLTFLIISSPTSIIFVLGILFFIILAKLEKIELNKANIEILIVSIFFYLWLNFILFKKAILFHGPSIIWQNIPKIYLTQYFSEINILQSVYLIGVLPFVLGIYSAYIYVTRQNSLQIYIIIGASSSLFLLLWFKLIPFKTGLIFLGAFLVILLSQYLKLFFDYILQTKFSKFSAFAFILFIIMILLSSVLPSVVLGYQKISNIPEKETLDAYSWISKNINSTNTVLALQDEGHALSYFGNVKTVADDNFIFVKNIDQHIYDVDRIYLTRFSDESLEIIHKYYIDYILIDKKVKLKYNLTDVFYSTDECFSLVYHTKDVKIYKILCEEEAI